MQPPPADATLRICGACGAPGTSRYCGECGASMAGPGDLIREDATELVGLDRRLLHTLRDLLLHPTRVVASHLSGERGRYVRPLKLFFSLAGLYMFLLTLSQPFSFETGGLFALSPEQLSAFEATLRERGLTLEEYVDRFQSRMNTATPVVVALALLPMAAVLRLLDRRRRVQENLVFLLDFSNAVWLVSLLMLPLTRLPIFYTVVLHLVAYAYLGVGYFTFYARPKRSQTAARFAAFAFADLLVTYVCTGALMVAVAASVLLL